MRLKANVRYVNPDGTFTPEALIAFRGSREKAAPILTPYYLAEDIGMLLFGVSTNLTFKRGEQSVNMTGVRSIGVATGDYISWSTVQAIAPRFIPML